MQSFVFKAPVTTVAGFGGKRIRVLASDGEQSAIAALGGSGVPMSLPEVLPALQQGTIDGVNSVLGVFVPFATTTRRRTWWTRRSGPSCRWHWSARPGSTGCRRT
jgi:TRAP-type C4-dicarboxylate transport system, periplasmic component